MKQFRFKLEGLLRQRERAEQERQRDLAAAQAQAVRLNQEKEKLNSQLAAGLDQTSSAATIAARGYALIAVRERIADITRQAVQANDRVYAARAALDEAVRQRKAIQSLRDNSKQNWRAALERDQRCQFDELSTNIAARPSLEK